MTKLILEIEKTLLEVNKNNNQESRRTRLAETVFELRRELTDDSSEGDYSDDDYQHYDGWDLSWDTIEEVELQDLRKEDKPAIDPDHWYKQSDNQSYKVHHCNQEKQLIICLGIQYALTYKLPAGYTPFVLINIIIEACVYSAFSGHGKIERFVADKDRIKKFVDPCEEWFLKSPLYYRQAFFKESFLRRIAKQGPYAHSSSEQPIPYRHRPWNNYFRQKIPAKLVLDQAIINYEGIPNFKVGVIQRTEIKSTSVFGKTSVKIVRGQKIRETLDESEYEKYNSKKRKREEHTVAVKQEIE